MLHLIGVHSSNSAFIVKQPQPNILAVLWTQSEVKGGFFPVTNFGEATNIFSVAENIFLKTCLAFEIHLNYSSFLSTVFWGNSFAKAFLIIFYKKFCNPYDVTGPLELSSS